MAKYLKLPVTGTSSPSLTVGIDGIFTVEKSSNTVAVLHYANGDAQQNIVNITHSATPTDDVYAMRDALSNAIINLQSSNWRETIATLDLGPIKTASGAPMVITSVAIA